MALQFTTVEEPSFGRGIDARSAENQIRDGFVRDLVNSDIVEGRVRKRKGYANYAGNIPVRVTAVRQTVPDKVGFLLDTSIDLSDVTSSPILVYGKYTSSLPDSVDYYPDWQTSIKKTLEDTARETSTIGTGAGVNTVNVVSTATFPTTGTFVLGGAITVYSYTGKTLTSLTGVTPAISYSAGQSVVGPSVKSIDIPVSEHAISSSDMYVGAVLATPQELVFTGEVSINPSSYNINIAYSNDGGPAQDVFIFYKNGQTILGETFVGSYPTTSAISITAATHNLSSNNITYQVYEDVGSALIRVVPNRVVLDKNAGDIAFIFSDGDTLTTGSGAAVTTINVATTENFPAVGSFVLGISPTVYTYTGKTSTSFTGVSPTVVSYTSGQTVTNFSTTKNYKVLLTAVPQANTTTISPTLTSPQGAPEDYRATLFNVTSPYVFYSVYKDSSGEEILPDSVLYSQNDQTLTFVFAKESYEAVGNQGPFRIFFHYGSIRANEILVTDTVLSNQYYTDPQLTIYGLSHGDVYDPNDLDEVLISSIYGPAKNENRRGWVTHLDSYRSPRTTHMVAGLGGNLFAALSPLDSSFPPTLLTATPTYYPNLSEKTTATEQVIGPALWESGIVSGRTRPTVHFSGGGSNWATVTAVAYDTNTGDTLYTLQLPNVYVSSGFLSNAIANTDYLTIKGMSHSRHNGTFKVVNIPFSLLGPGGFATIRVTNPNMKTSDYDDTGCSGLGGVFTDNVTFAEPSPFVQNDTLLSPAWSDNSELVVVSTNSSVTTVGQLYSRIVVSAGLTITGRRTSDEIPLRTQGGTAASQYLVVGDTVYFGELNRPLQITHIDYVNHVVTVDESFTWEDNIALPSPFRVVQRWIPAETPVPPSSDSEYSLIPKTTVQHLSVNPYDDQPFLRSAMVQNNLYLTNGSDEVYKYDGQNFYRAGLIPWQPGLFLAVENVASGGIAIAGSGRRTPTALVGSQLRLTAAEASYFQSGDVVRFTNGEGINQLLTISGITAEASPSTDKLFSFSETLNFSSLGSSPGITAVYQARYYFRINVRDVNGVTVSSAVTGSLDFVATISPETGKQLKVLLRLVGLPPWDRYDFRNKNIELEVYRTLWSRGSLGEVPAFYRIQSLGLTYENNSGYIDITDVYSNNTLTDSQQDSLVGVLSPEGIPADWDEPARAKYVTTAGNRLVLANVTDWPTLTVTYLGAGTTPFASFAGQKFLYRRDSSDVDTITNMLDRVTYELVSSSAAKTIYPVAGTSGHFKFSATTALPTGLAAKDWVYLYHSTVSSGNVAEAVIPPVPTTTLDVEESSVFPVVGSMVHFTTTGTLPNISPSGTLATNKGYFVTSVSTNVSGITAVNQNTAAGTIQLVSSTGFPGTGKVTINGITHAYSSVATNTLNGVSPLVSFTKDTVVYLVPNITISETYGGSPIAFTSTGSGVSILWDGSELDHAGWYQVVDATGGVVTIHSPNLNWSTIPTQFPDRALFATNLEDVPVLTGIDGNLGMFNGNGPLPWLTILRRLGMAINATMRVTDTTLAGQNAFVPWLIARSESDTGNQLIVKQPRAEVAIPSLTLKGPTTTINGAVANSSTVTLTDASQLQSAGTILVNGNTYLYTGKAVNILSGLSPVLTASNGAIVEAGIGVDTYVNGALTRVGTSSNLVTTRYPSRILASYNNYPEIFDNPWTVDSDFSDSAVDVNSADGQEITGIIPFFGESAFGASLQSGVLVVFKQNSIYLVDLSAKAAGQNPVQRLETQGLGCTAPYSIASTKDGIAFANDSGIYVLRRNQRIEYLGRYVERLWQQAVDKDNLSLVQGHHYGVGRQYKLSVPLAAESLIGYAENSEVYVYNHTGETADEPGGWGRYTNHPATGWANLYQDAFFCTTGGTIKRIRNSGESSDYRDDSAAIESTLEGRATAYGNTGIRKVVANVTVHYRSGGNSESTSVYMATDLYQEYDLSSSFKILSRPGTIDGLGTVAGQDVVSIMHSFPRRRCIYMAIKITNNGKDENVEIAGFSYSVAGLSGTGIQQAQETK